MNVHIIAQINVAHALRRDEDELPSNRASRGLDHETHALSTIDAVHVDIEFVQTSNRRSHGFPDTEQ